MAAGTSFLPEIGLGMGVSFEDGALAAFFVVEDEGYGDAGGVGPEGIGWGGAVAGEVTGELMLGVDLRHCSSRSSKGGVER